MGPSPLFTCYVAEMDSALVGYVGLTFEFDYASLGARDDKWHHLFLPEPALCELAKSA